MGVGLNYIPVASRFWDLGLHILQLHLTHVIQLRLKSHSGQAGLVGMERAKVDAGKAYLAVGTGLW